MYKSNLVIISSILFFFLGCKEDALPKPKGELRLSYAAHTYKAFNSPCPFTFQYASIALKKQKEGCNYTLYYPGLKATLYLTYQNIDNNLDILLKEAEKSVYEPHTARADYINPRIIVREGDKVFGTLYELGGDAALNYQFHVTDSTKNFLRGAVYFNARPNADSLAPAIKVMGEEMTHLMETVQWKK